MLVGGCGNAGLLPATIWLNWVVLASDTATDWDGGGHQFLENPRLPCEQQSAQRETLGIYEAVFMSVKVRA